MRTEIIRKKTIEIKESIELIKNNLPDSLLDFESLGLIKDGISDFDEFIEQIEMFMKTHQASSPSQ